MSNQDNDIGQKLLEVFRQESQEHLRVISHGLIELEQSRPDEHPALFEQLFRAAHNFKGASAAVNQSAVENICQSLETVIASWKEEKLSPAKQQLDALHEVLGTVKILLEEQITSVKAPPVRQTISRLSALLKEQQTSSEQTIQAEYSWAAGQQKENKKPTAAASGPSPADPLLDTVRLSTERLDLLLREAEEMLSVGTMISGSIDELKHISRQLKSWKTEISDQKQYTALNPLDSSAPGKYQTVSEKLKEWMEWNESQVITLQETVNDMLASLRERNISFTTMAHRHLESMKEASLLPFSMLTGSLRKTARDLLHLQGKEAALDIAGDDIEIDRRILQELKDPLLHLVRNAVDHGLESPEERRGAGKKTGGRISIHMQRLDNSKFRIIIADDGGGIDVREIKKAAAAKGLLSAEELQAMSRSEMFNLIFRSGVSTRSAVSTISGRGIGMAIVREAIERLSGQVWVESEPGSGTTFYLELPTTISTLRALRIRLGARHFMLPLAFVVRALRVFPDMVQTVGNRETIVFEGETVAFIHLGRMLGLSLKNDRDDVMKRTLILQSSGKRIALQVDQIIDEQEVLMKGLGPQLERVRMIAGGAVLGNGEVVPILNITDLLGLEQLKRAESPAAPHEAPSPRAQKMILVVDDSITSRTLLKSVFGSAGFGVQTAKDGAEALAMLKTKPFDAVVSDVDMPRMDGFELTRNIRSDEALADLPVVLVTALESRSDQELGIDAGANAYIVKSRFDNMNLLQTMGRLI